MTHPDLCVTTEGGVATIQIRRAPHNYFDPPLVAGLADSALALAGDLDIRCIVLCSEGRSFCAGANFAVPRHRDAGPSSEPADSEQQRRPRHMYEDAVRLIDVEVPMVAAVQGAAIGGGLGLALTCDFRVATPRHPLRGQLRQLGDPSRIRSLSHLAQGCGRPAGCQDPPGWPPSCRPGGGSDRPV